MSALLAVAAIALAGWALAALAVPPGRLRLALAPLLGLGTWSASYSAVLFALEASPVVRSGKDAVLALAGAAVLIMRRRIVRLSGSSASPGLSRGPEAAIPVPGGGLPRWLPSAVAVAAVLAAAFFLEHTLRYPDGGWDAWMIWNLRARFLARAGGGFRAAFSPELLFWAHQDYPLMLPGIVAQVFLLAGAEPIWLPALVAAGIAALDVLVLAAALRELRGPGWGSVGALVLLATPCFIPFAANQQSDVPEGAFLLAAAVLAALAVETGARRALALSGLAASFACWTKNEGALYGLSLAAALLTVRWAPPRQRLRGVLLFGAGALPVLALLGWFKLRFAHVNDLLHGASAARLVDPSRWGVLVIDLMRRIVYFQGWALWLIAEVAVLALVLPRLPPRPAARAVGAALALALAGTLPIYLLQPHPLAWFFRASFDRVLIQLWPSILLATILALAAPAPPRPPATART